MTLTSLEKRSVRKMYVIISPGCRNVPWIPAFEIGSHISDRRFRFPGAWVTVIDMGQHHIKRLARRYGVCHDMAIVSNPDPVLEDTSSPYGDVAYQRFKAGFSRSQAVSGSSFIFVTSTV